MSKILTFKDDGAFWPLAERPASSGHPFAGLAGAARRALAALAHEIATRRAMRTLASFDDRMLQDIGIDRGQIPLAARYGRGAIETSGDITLLARW
jgi:uncharacterized protein YjiS (DUF1127 family)